MSSAFWLPSEDEWDDHIYTSDSGSDTEVRASRYGDLEDEEVETKRVTKSAFEKKHDELIEHIEFIEAKLTVKGWVDISSEWDKLVKTMQKGKSVFDKSGIPKFLTKFLIRLADTLTEKAADKEYRKELSSTASKSLNSLSGQFKKWLKANKEQSARIEEFRANPKLAESDDESSQAAKSQSSKSSSANSNTTSNAKKTVDAAARNVPALKPGVVPTSTSSTSSGAASTTGGASAGGSSSTTAAASSGATEDGKPVLVGRAKWLKRAGDSSSSSDSSDEDDWNPDDEDDDFDSDVDKRSRSKKTPGKPQAVGGKPGKKPTVATSDSDEDESGSDSDEDGDSKSRNKSHVSSKKQQYAADKEWSVEKQDTRYKELMARRGTRSYDRVDQILQIALLIEKCKEKGYTVDRHLKFLFSLVDALFDHNSSMDSFLHVRLWKYCFNTLWEIIEIVQNPQNAKLVQLVDIDELDPSAIIPQVRGYILPQFLRLDTEYTKSLQMMDPDTTDYVLRLQHETQLLRMAKVLQTWFESRGEHQKASQIAARRLEHLHYRRELDNLAQRTVQRETARLLREQRQADNETNEKNSSNKAGDADGVSMADDKSVAATIASSSGATTTSTILIGGVLTTAITAIPDEEVKIISGVEDDTQFTTLIPQLCQMVYRRGEDTLTIRALLYHIYHLALHDKFAEAREMFHATRLQEEIDRSEIGLQILYNRALVQLGLAAFRRCRIVDAAFALQEVSLKSKELLAQSMTRGIDRTLEQEKLERRRLIPFPMHINLELLEFAQLTSTMLLEVPNIAAGVEVNKLRLAAKKFRKTLESLERTPFSGPPENTRDHVLAAAKALLQSDWERCVEHIFAVEMWNLIPKADEIKPLFKRKIQDTALRTFLLTNSQYYESISLTTLAEMFDLPTNSVHAIVSGMMNSEEIHASWDQPAGAIVMNGSHNSRLQSLCLTLTERLSTMFESVDSQSQDSRGNSNVGSSGSGNVGSQQGQYQNVNAGQGGQGGQGQRNWDGTSGSYTAASNQGRDNRNRNYNPNNTGNSGDGHKRGPRKQDDQSSGGQGGHYKKGMSKRTGTSQQHQNQNQQQNQQQRQGMKKKH